MHPTDFQRLMLPLLECLKEGAEQSLEYLKTKLTEHVERSDDPERYREGFTKAVLLAREHLLKADLVTTTRENQLKITALGKMLLSKRLNSLDVDYLRRLPGYGKA